MNKWISSKTNAGKKRSFDTMGIFAVNNAFAEKLPFTALNCCMIKGRHITHNFPKNS